MSAGPWSALLHQCCRHPSLGDVEAICTEELGDDAVRRNKAKTEARGVRYRIARSYRLGLTRSNATPASIERTRIVGLARIASSTLDRQSLLAGSVQGGPRPVT